MNHLLKLLYFLFFQADTATGISGRRLHSDATWTYEYDYRGNLERKTANDGSGLRWSYTWDTRGRLVNAALEDGATTKRMVKYYYDVLGRRVAKTIDDYETGILGKTTKYAYDGDDILYEFDMNNELIARHTHGPGVDDPLYTTTQAQDGTIENYYYHKDGINSVREITNEDGEVVHRTDFDTFGNILAVNDCPYSSTLSSSNASIGDPAYHHDFFFTYSYTGRQWDAETDMYYYRARYYDAEIGRFISEDPQWNTNFYAYVGNNPISYFDPSGKFIELLFWTTFIFVPTALWAYEKGINPQLFRNLSMNDISYLYLGITSSIELKIEILYAGGTQFLYLSAYIAIGRMYKGKKGRAILRDAVENGLKEIYVGVEGLDEVFGPGTAGAYFEKTGTLYIGDESSDWSGVGKVMIHELFHASGWDSKHFFSSDLFDHFGRGANIEGMPWGDALILFEETMIFSILEGH